MRTLILAACVVAPTLAAQGRASPAPPLGAWTPVPELPGMGRPVDKATRDEPRLRDLVFAGRDVRNLRPIVDSLRLVKDADEVARMRKAIDISVLGHVAAMQAARPGVWEYEIEAALEAEFRRNGADRVG